MTLTQALLFAGLAVLIGLVTRNRFRITFLFVLSVLAVFWLQPALPVRNLDFWLPVATLALVFLTWVLLSSDEQKALRSNRLAAGALFGLVLLVGLARFLPAGFSITASPAPQTEQIIIALGLAALLAVVIQRWPRRSFFAIALILLIGLLVIQKTPLLAEWSSSLLRALEGQSAQRAAALDIRWLGFSYLAFRLIHTIRDRQAGRLPDVSLSEYLTYVIFFPSITAGPIDRLERFSGDLRRPLALARADWISAGERFFVGLFKKYVLADSLALIALNGTNSTRIAHTSWAWVLLYAYALQIYFDFSGYTDTLVSAKWNLDKLEKEQKQVSKMTGDACQ